MYCFTIFGSGHSVPIKSSASTPQQQTTYRWGSVWGLHKKGMSWDACWTAERRQYLVHKVIHKDTLLLESVIPVNVHSPPPHVDDVWTEEVCVDGNIVYTGERVCITGTKKEILDACCRIGFTLPEMFEAYMKTEEVSNQTQPPQLPEPSVSHLKQFQGRQQRPPFERKHAHGQHQSHRQLQGERSRPPFQGRLEGHLPVQRIAQFDGSLPLPDPAFFHQEFPRHPPVQPILGHAEVNHRRSFAYQKYRR